MHKTTARSPLLGEERAAPCRRSFAAHFLRRLIGGDTCGRLTVRLPSGERLEFGNGQSGPEADIAVSRWRALRRLFFGGDIGFAEAYRDEDWSTSDLTALLLWAMGNETAMATFARGLAPSRTLKRIQHLCRTNTRANSQRNIRAHYDLGNAFYAQWLDEAMNYSSGLYTTPLTSLDEAQLAKLDRVVDVLDVKKGQRILEIGCGWGALAERLIEKHRCHVTGLTLSTPQRDYALERLRRRRLDGFSDIRLQDYRDVDGVFDRIVSIEMLEAVGEAYWPTYFSKLRECLAPGGIAVLQVITIAPSRYEDYRRRPDFIQRHIFPGGMLPTPTIIANEARRAGLVLTSNESFGASYAKTLADWLSRFDRAWPSISRMGFDERFRRLWTYYLAYCQAGFVSGGLDVGLYRLQCPESASDNNPVPMPARKRAS